MRICRTTEIIVRVVSGSEVLVMFVTSDGVGLARSISEWHKMLERRRVGKGK
jgi:hypothetical protein